ncbi:unnamed protein product [Musa acuminata subsp. malaccensis]|uniref:(wild Malaysian banana) hypothetical protein n=1 Tax=Musa acuminata subsp. malaccensis TaxID=214687 RepID=A0A804ITZ9_MUSAM|nr:unnamed protein product [Musa acuminata subsp. malaccensis]
MARNSGPPYTRQPFCVCLTMQGWSNHVVSAWLRGKEEFMGLSAPRALPFFLGTPKPQRLCSSPIGIELIAEKG